MARIIRFKEIGERAAMRRKALGMTQEQARELLHWGSREDVSKFETGGTITFQKCQDISICYDITLNWLLFGEGEPTKEVFEGSVDDAIERTVGLINYLINVRLPFLEKEKKALLKVGEKALSNATVVIAEEDEAGMHLAKLMSSKLEEDDYSPILVIKGSGIE